MPSSDLSVQFDMMMIRDVMLQTYVVKPLSEFEHFWLKQMFHNQMFHNQMLCLLFFSAEASKLTFEKQSFTFEN